MTDRFGWHASARLFDGAGREVRPRPAGAAAILPDSAEGLAAAIGRDAFRIGAPDQPAPDPEPVPIFETLTSGSTGAPRRIRRTQGSWTASFAVNARFGIGPGARVAVLGRLVQSLALYGAVEGLHLGAEVHLFAGLRPDRQLKALASSGISHLYATPAQLRALVEGAGTCPDLRQVLVGGSKLDPALRAALRSMAPGADVREFYGAAEASFITLTDADTPDGSVGRAYPGVTISVDPSGEIWVRSPYLFLGYADAAPPLAKCALPSPPVREGEGGGTLAPVGSARWQGGWLSLGEVGRLQDGFLYLHGRAGRMVTVADQNVFPEEIEALMQGLHGIARAAVVPVPDARRGSALLAFAQGDAACEAAVMAALRKRLGPLKAPKALVWLGDWPMLPSGKTDLRALEVLARWPV